MARDKQLWAATVGAAIILLCGSVRLFAVDQNPAGTKLCPASQTRVDWFTKTTSDAYLADGHRNPKWDADVKTALSAEDRMWGAAPNLGGDENQILLYASDRAVKKGCDDPLLLYCRGRALNFYRAKKTEVASFQIRAAEGMLKSQYPAVRKCFALLRSADARIALKDDDASHQLARADIEQALKLLPEAAADPKIPTEEVGDLLQGFAEASQRVEADWTVIPKRALVILDHSPLTKSAVLTARGMVDLEYGEIARGGGFAGTVTDQGWKTMAQRVALARTHFEQAWQLDHNDGAAARLMLDAETLDSRGPQVFDLWYARAIAANPDDRRIYRAKLNWLEPKWYGSIDRMLAYGRECVRQNNWAGQTPMVLVDAYWAAGKYDGPSYPPAPFRKYFADNPKAWEEMQPIFEQYLKRPDASSFYKTRYAVIAADSGQWRAADSMLTSLHGHIADNVLYDWNAVNALVKEAAENAKAPPETDAAAPKGSAG